jgi:hypothetical protein
MEKLDPKPSVPQESFCSNQTEHCKPGESSSLSRAERDLSSCIIGDHDNQDIPSFLCLTDDGNNDGKADKDNEDNDAYDGDGYSTAGIFFQDEEGRFRYCKYNWIELTTYETHCMCTITMTTYANADDSFDEAEMSDVRADQTDDETIEYKIQIPEYPFTPIETYSLMLEDVCNTFNIPREGARTLRHLINKMLSDKKLGMCLQANGGAFLVEWLLQDESFSNLVLLPMQMVRVSF